MTDATKMSRRSVMQAGAGLTTVPTLGFAQSTAALPAARIQPSLPATPPPTLPPTLLPVRLTVNGQVQTLNVDTRTTLLDALRETLLLKGTKKGCDHGQCGACTVLLDGRRINACLTLAVMHEGQTVTTIEGLSEGENLHPMQAAFLKHDGFQCGYCTPGQICSAVGMLREAGQGMASHVSTDLLSKPQLSAEEIRERMSGNLCRCSAYPNIVAAIQEVAA